MTDDGAPATPPPTSDYGLSPQLRARLMGVALATIGAVLVIATVLVTVFRLPLDILSALVILAVLVIVGLGFLLLRRWYVVRLDATGYQVRLVRGVGASAGHWTDVEDLATTVVAGSPCVVLRLRSGRTTTIPVDLLAGDREAFVDDLRAHLDRGHGYRRVG